MLLFLVKCKTYTLQVHLYVLMFLMKSHQVTHRDRQSNEGFLFPTVTGGVLQVVSGVLGETVMGGVGSRAVVGEAGCNSCLHLALAPPCSKGSTPSFLVPAAASDPPSTRSTSLPPRRTVCTTTRTGTCPRPATHCHTPPSPR